MEIKINPDSFLIFDLDDTLYPEIEFLQSGYQRIAGMLLPYIGTDIYADMWTGYRNGENVFQWVVQEFGSQVPLLSVVSLLTIYREHFPAIRLRKGVSALLEHLAYLHVPAGIITDGRSCTQRNKLQALHLEHYFKEVIISEEFGSEKPDERNFRFFMDKYPAHEFVFIGDNTSKDFITPARLGWHTICIKDDGTHIHPQIFGNRSYPACVIDSFESLQLVWQACHHGPCSL